MSDAFMLGRAGRWFLDSGIQDPSGGVARYYDATTGRNRAVSTEITGYTASAFAYLYCATGEAAYLERARLTAHFLIEGAWDQALKTFPFEHPSPSDDIEHQSYFFDCGIIIRGLLAVWRYTREECFLEVATTAAHAMVHDFHSGTDFHPVLSLPDKRPLARDDRWSRSSACYQLKAAESWWQVAGITGDSELQNSFLEVLDVSLADHASFLSGVNEPHRLMDRLHAYCYFLEGLIPVMAQRTNCREVYREGLASIARYLNDIAPSFVRSDVYAQLLRARIYGAALDVVPMDVDAAAREAAALAQFQFNDRDVRLDGAFAFGRRDGALVPHVNPLGHRVCIAGARYVAEFPGRTLKTLSRPAHLTKAYVAFATGTEKLNSDFLERFAAAAPAGVHLYAVSEFPPRVGEWLAWHVFRSPKENLDAVRAALAGVEIEAAGFVLDAHPPLRPMRKAALRIGAKRIVAYDHRMQPVPFSACGLLALCKEGVWRLRFSLNAQFASTGRLKLWINRLQHPAQAEIPLLARRAQLYGWFAGRLRGRRTEHPIRSTFSLQRGVSVVIPSRDGRKLLETLFPTLLPQLRDGEVIVSDNGSRDGTRDWLAQYQPDVQVIHTVAPLSFSRAVNLGISQARYSHVFLLNNDMVLEPGCLDSLLQAFTKVPDLFCATAQIFFPQGIRREETGKTVWRKVEPLDFPVRCDDPLDGEDLTWVLYGSGGCSLFDTAKLLALGGVAEIYEPAYVEDMDFGYRAWKRGWPTVYCAKAKVEHRHRATTARFYSAEQLQGFVERNYLRFLISAIGSRPLFQTLWSEAIRRLQLLAMRGDAAALTALRNVPQITSLPEPSRGPLDEHAILALGNGDLAVFPGRGRTNNPIVIASPYLPYPLSHGGAVRIFHLMREANRHRGQVLVSFCDALEPVPVELLEVCSEVVLVRRHGTHYRKNTPLPDTVEEFASLTFEAALRMTIAKWSPGLVQLEYTQMAQYAASCHPAKTLLVEHDITFDLHQQLVESNQQNSVARLEHERQFARWKSFEVNAWREVDQVVAMSNKDRVLVEGLAEGKAKVECLPNGVDTERFQPSETLDDAEHGRILFIGSFAHLPNVLGLAWFLRDVWPLLGPGYQLHVIGGARHSKYMEQLGEFAQDRIEVEGFVADVRPAYRRAEIVIAPLQTSAGTNIKVLEAMAMGRCVVSTPAGITGLEVANAEDVVLASEAPLFAEAIQRLSADSSRRRQIETQARTTVVAKYDWRAIGNRQSDLYDRLTQ